MDFYQFGNIGSIFSPNQPPQEEIESTQRSDHKYDFAAEYTPPDVSEITQPIFQKQQKQNTLETLVPTVVGKVLSNIIDPNQKLKIFNTPVFGMCIMGKVTNLEKLASLFQFDLEDPTGSIKIHFSNVSVELEEDDYVQVVGSLVLLALDNFYVDSQHLINYGKYSELVDQRLRYHNVLVAFAAYNLDVSEKLKLENKHVGKVSDLPGPLSYRDFEGLELGPEYDHITISVELSIIKYLKSNPDTVSKKSTLYKSLNHLYEGEFFNF